MGVGEAGERQVTEVGETSCRVHALPPRSTTGSADTPWRPEPVEGNLATLTGRLGKNELVTLIDDCKSITWSHCQDWESMTQHCKDKLMRKYCRISCRKVYL